MKDWLKLAKANPKISIGIAVAILIILFAEASCNSITKYVIYMYTCPCVGKF